MIKRTKIKNYLLNNEDVLMEVIEELNIIDSDVLTSIREEIEETLEVELWEEIQIYKENIIEIVKYVVMYSEDIEINDKKLIELLAME